MEGQHQNDGYYVALNYVGVKGVRVEKLNVDGQFGLVDVLLKSNRKHNLDVKQLSQSLIEETGPPVFDGNEIDRPVQIFNQRERVL